METEAANATRARGSQPEREQAPPGVTLPMWASRWWLLVLPLALVETVALGVRVARVAPQGDWNRAAAHVREHYQQGDAITSAPAWTDPTLRLHLGDRIGLDMAGRSDLAGYERLWVLAIRGANAADAPARAPDEEWAFGRVTLRRYDLGPSTEVLDLADALPDARVTVQRGGRELPCRYRSSGGDRAEGGLFYGPVRPAQRFQCDPKRPWNYVGLTVMEDLELRPRRCIWQHPVGREPVAVTYEDVPLGTHLVMHGGLYYHHERALEGADVQVRVLVDGREVDRWTHRDGEGFERRRVPTLADRPAGAPPRGDLRIEVTSEAPHLRSFCWAGSILDAEREEAP